MALLFPLVNSVALLPMETLLLKSSLGLVGVSVHHFILKGHTAPADLQLSDPGFRASWCDPADVASTVFSEAIRSWPVFCVTLASSLLSRFHSHRCPAASPGSATGPWPSCHLTLISSTNMGSTTCVHRHHPWPLGPHSASRVPSRTVRSWITAWGRGSASFHTSASQSPTPTSESPVTAWV